MRSPFREDGQPETREARSDGASDGPGLLVSSRPLARCKVPSRTRELASLPALSWLFFLFLAAAIPLLVCTALLLVASVPSGAGRAGWRNPLRLPRREGVASWSELHPAFPVRTHRRSLVGRVERAPQAEHLGRRPAVRPAMARLVTDLQRTVAALVRLRCCGLGDHRVTPPDGGTPVALPGRG